MDWISTYDSSLLVCLGPIHKDNNGTKWWRLRITGAVSPPWYHFSASRFSTLIMLSLQTPKNLINIISFSHESKTALQSKIWLVKHVWRLRLATCCFNCSSSIYSITGSTNSFSTNTKIMLMETQKFFHKVLVIFVLFFTTVREVNQFFIISRWSALR